MTRTDTAEMVPDLELTFGPRTLQCVGKLDCRTKRHVLEAMELVLQGAPASVDLDVSGLFVADADGANTLVLLQSMVEAAGVDLHWRGLDAPHFSDGVPQHW